MNRVIKALSCIGVFSFLGFIPLVSAASTCDYEAQVNLRKEANNVQATFEASWYGTGEYEPLEVPDDDGNTEYELKEPGVINYIYNITNNIYVVVRNTKTEESKTYTFADSTEGRISWYTDAKEIRNYEIKIYSNHPDCTGEEYNKISLITPMYNNNSGRLYCKNNTEYYCNEFITTEINMTEDQIYQKAIEEELKRNAANEQKEEKEKSFLQKYGIYIGGVLAIILTGVLITVILRKVKRSKTI